MLLLFASLDLFSVVAFVLSVNLCTLLVSMAVLELLSENGYEVPQQKVFFFQLWLKLITLTVSLLIYLHV